MNYIAEINSFYDWLEINQVSSSAISLWHALMAVANKASWQSRFTVAISVLELKTGLQRRTLERARNELQQKGRISWKKRSGNLAAEYSLISLCDKTSINYDAQSVVQSVAQVDVQSVAQPVDINKLNYTKQNIIINGEEKILPEDLFKTLNNILTQQSYLEMLCMNFSIKSLQDLSNYLKRFFVDLATRGELRRDVEDAKSHFSNWLKTELSREKRESKKTKINKTVHPINDSLESKVYTKF